MFILSLAAPTQAPHNISVYNTSSSSLAVEWTAPPDEETHGIVRGYKILLYQTEQRTGTEKLTVTHEKRSGARRKRRSATSSNTHTKHFTGLQKFTNYTVQVLVYTISDGPFSTPYKVTTDQDGKSMDRAVIWVRYCQVLS